VARVALNLRGVERDEVSRGDALVSPGAFLPTDTMDVRVRGLPTAELPASLVLHLGSAAVPVRVRPLGADTARLTATSALPLRIGDRALLRDPGRRAVLGGVTVLDVRPPALRRRGAAAARAEELTQLDGRPDEAGELRRRRLVRRSELVAMGVDAVGTPVAGEWLADPTAWSGLRAAVADEVRRYCAEHPLEPGAPVDAVRQRLGLPDRVLVEALAAGQLEARGGRLVPAASTALPAAVAAAVRAVEGELREASFRAPEADRLAALGLGTRELAAAVRVGALLKVADGVYLLPDAPDRAAALLAGLPQPFTLSEARQGLGTTRRVAVPFLELLDRTGVTRRLPDDRRVVRPSGG